MRHSLWARIKLWLSLIKLWTLWSCPKLSSLRIYPWLTALWIHSRLPSLRHSLWARIKLWLTLIKLWTLWSCSKLSSLWITLHPLIKMLIHPRLSLWIHSRLTWIILWPLWTTELLSLWIHPLLTIIIVTHIISSYVMWDKWLIPFVPLIITHFFQFAKHFLAFYY